MNTYHYNYMYLQNFFHFNHNSIKLKTILLLTKVQVLP
jgi:hypothetical protein